MSIILDESLVSAAGLTWHILFSTQVSSGHRAPWFWFSIAWAWQRETGRPRTQYESTRWHVSESVYLFLTGAGWGQHVISSWNLVGSMKNNCCYTGKLKKETYGGSFTFTRKKPHKRRLIPSWPINITGVTPPLSHAMVRIGECTVEYCEGIFVTYCTASTL